MMFPEPRSRHAELRFEMLPVPTNDNVLAILDRRHTPGRGLLAARQARDAGFEHVNLDLIYGTPGERPDDFAASLDAVVDAGVDHVSAYSLIVEEGTRLHARMRAEGRLLGAMTGDNADGSINFVPRLDPAFLRSGYRQLLEELYAPRAFYRRVRDLLRELKVPEVRMRLDRQRWLALPRSALRLGIVGRERFQYWRLIGWTLVRRPRLLSRAVTLSIYGHYDDDDLDAAYKALARAREGRA